MILSRVELVTTSSLVVQELTRRLSMLSIQNSNLMYLTMEVFRLLVPKAPMSFVV